MAATNKMQSKMDELNEQISRITAEILDTLGEALPKYMEREARRVFVESGEYGDQLSDDELVEFKRDLERTARETTEHVLSLTNAPGYLEGRLERANIFVYVREKVHRAMDSLFGEYQLPQPMLSQPTLPEQSRYGLLLLNESFLPEPYGDKLAKLLQELYGLRNKRSTLEKSLQIEKEGEAKAAKRRRWDSI